MRFRCIIGILFFLTLKTSEAATQASCTTRIHYWIWCDQAQPLKTCFSNIDEINDQDFTISTVVDRSTLAFSITQKPGVKFLPTNISRIFPDLVVYQLNDCSVMTVSGNHFKNLLQLKILNLWRNKIEHVASDAFVDLVSLEELGLGGNRIQSFPANTFSSLKALKELYLKGNKIQHLDPNIFSSLVKVEGLVLSSNSISNLDEKMFESLTNLKDILFSNNKLEEIPRNLFQNNLKLEKIWFDRNEIKFIDANMFDHLSNLKLVNLEDNVCVNKFHYKKSFDAMKSDLKQNCSAALASSGGVPSHATGLFSQGENFTLGSFPWIVALVLAFKIELQAIVT